MNSPNNRGSKQTASGRLPKFGESIFEEISAEKIKLVFVGDRSVGKTSLIVTFSTKQFPESNPPTVLEAYTGQTKHRDKDVDLNIFDTAGHEDFQRVRPISYNKADVIVICFSLVDKDSLTNACTKWYREVRSLGPKCPMILVGTKLDLKEKIMKTGNA